MIKDKQISFVSSG